MTERKGKPEKIQICVMSFMKDPQVPANYKLFDNEVSDSCYESNRKCKNK